MKSGFETLVEDLRRAAASDAPSAAVGDVLAGVIEDAESHAARIAALDEDEVLLFEDDAVSIWTCRFHPDVLLPPHNHRMPVQIAVVGGAERNILYRRTEKALEEAAVTDVPAGRILPLGPEAVHAVTAAGPEPSLAVHVYLGPLTRIERSLFDWDTGAPKSFTDANFETMKRPVGVS